MSEPVIISPQELSSWRELPVTARVLDWLRGQVKVYQENIPDYIVRNEIEKARAAAGALRGYEEILAALTAEPIEQETEPEAPFRDPAARPTKEKKR